MEIDEADVVVAAAQHQVGLLPREELPMLAAEWLVAGLDTPLLRELAGLHRDDRTVTGLWPEVLTELEVVVPIAAPLIICAGRWTCDSDPAHDVGEVGALHRRDAELHLTE